MSYYQQLIEKEERSGIRKARLIDFLLFLYLLEGTIYLFESLELLPALPSDIVLYASAALSIAAALFQPGHYSLGHLIIFRTNKVLKTVYRTKYVLSLNNPTGLLTGLLIALTFGLSLVLTNFSFAALFSTEGMMGASRIFSSLFKPEFSITGMVLKAMVETIFIAFLATFVAIPIAFVVSFFAARNLMKRSRWQVSVYTAIRVTANFSRSIEPLIWAIIFSVWVGIGPFAGMLALMIHSIASLVKQYSEQIESINHGPIEAIEATGANAIQTVWYAVVPQVVLPFLSYTIYRWDINIRMATIIGLVGGGGVGTLLMQYQGLAKWNEVGTIVIVIALVVWLMDYLSAKIREAIY